MTISCITHRHYGLGYPGEYSGSQGVQQDLTLQQDEVQQRGTVLWAQVNQQCTVVCTTEEREQGTRERRGGKESWEEKSTEVLGKGFKRDSGIQWVMKGWIGWRVCKRYMCSKEGVWVNQKRGEGKLGVNQGGVKVNCIETKDQVTKPGSFKNLLRGKILYFIFRVNFANACKSIPKALASKSSSPKRHELTSWPSIEEFVVLDTSLWKWKELKVPYAEYTLNLAPLLTTFWIDTDLLQVKRKSMLDRNIVNKGGKLGE